MTDPRRLLSQWIADPAAALLSPLGDGSGFSGAHLWKVEHGVANYVLRQWPRFSGAAARIGTIARLQMHLADAGLPVPAPLLTLGGETTLSTAELGQQVTWSMSTWAPGVADYWVDPRTEKLESALRLLAAVHQSAAEFSANDEGHGRRVDVSPAALRRIQKLDQLGAETLADLKHGARHSEELEERSLSQEALQLIGRALNSQRQASKRWQHERLPLQWRIGDLWHDHVLFTGERVTGLIDFGAAGIDAPAGDVARLLGSFVGDDGQRWRQGLSVYEAVRPLSDVERDASQFFDSSGTLLSAANWVGWLWPKYPAHAPEIANRRAALDRLWRLVERLRVLAGRD